MNLEGKVVIVTGAASGIGRELARAFAARRARVAVCDIDGDGAEAVAADLRASHGEAVAIRCDVSSDGDVAAMIDRVMSLHGRVDVICNNAGIGGMAGAAHLIPTEEWQRVFDVNVLGAVRANNLLLPIMAKQGGGLIINTCSDLALFPEGVTLLPYVTTKAALLGMSECLAIYGEPLKIRVMALLPTFTVTNFAQSLKIGEIPADLLDGMMPKHNVQAPSDIVDALFNAIDAGSFIATSLPNFSEHLLDKAESGLNPAWRIHPETKDAHDQLIIRSTLQ